MLLPGQDTSGTADSVPQVRVPVENPAGPGVDLKFVLYIPVQEVPLIAGTAVVPLLPQAHVRGGGAGDLFLYQGGRLFQGDGVLRQGGQMLLVTHGRGWYCEWEGVARELKPGDVVDIPAGVKHWHGAAKDSWFAHVSIEIDPEKGPAEWLEPVADEEYARLP